MTLLITNSSQFVMIMNSACEKALDNTMDKLLDKLLEIIDRDVYSYKSDGDWNGRTYEFRDSWDTTKTQIIGQYMTSELSNENGHFAWNNIRNEWAHGNGKSPLGMSGDSIAMSINKIIDNRNGGSNFGFPSLKRPFWNEFEKWCMVNVDEIFKNELQKILGVQITSSAKIL